MRSLTKEEIECRVQQIGDGWCRLLLYKTARCDRAILDEVYGAEYWQNDFKVVDGKIYGSISVWNKELGQWITKWDVGTESNTEAEKGQASDCFKRAGFKWGIGVELYSAPKIFVSIETVKTDRGSYILKDKKEEFSVSDIGIENGKIVSLEISNRNGDVVYSMGNKVKPKAKPVDNSELLKKYKETLESLDMVGDGTIKESEKKEMFGNTIPPLMLALKKAGLTKELEHLGEVFAKKIIKEV